MRKNPIRIALAYFILILLSALALVPVLSGAITAFKPQHIWVSSPPTWIFTPTMENFRHILVRQEGLDKLLNSLIVSTGTVIIALMVGVPAAYAFARFRFRSAQPLLGWLISTRMIPPIVVALPFYQMFRFMHLINTHIGLVLVYLSFSIPLVIWIMRGYFVDLPPEIEESAMVDGCGRLEALRRVVLPLILPGVVATGLLVFIFSWNEFLLALILTGRDTNTLPVAAAGYVGLVRVEWGNLFATNLIIMMPVLILVSLLHRQFVRGLTFGMTE